MSQPSSIPSTEVLGISSAGQSYHDCVKPWNPSQWYEQEDFGSDWNVQIECTPGRILSFHGTQLEAPDFSSPKDKVSFILRRVCHLLVDRIGSEGLQEVCQSLAEFYQYYRPAEESRSLLPESRTREAIISAQTVRPAFTIEEE